MSLDPESSLALEGAGEAYLAQAHARTSEGLYTAATTALRNGCEVTRRFLAKTNLAASGASCDAGVGISVKPAPTETGECAWKLLGDLYTYAHKLPPMCFGGEGQPGGEADAMGLELGTEEAAAHQAVRIGVWL